MGWGRLYERIELATVTSSPLTVVIAEMLQNSDNNTAEMLVKEIGLHSGNGNRRDGLAAVHNSLRSQGVNLSDLQLVDGSGLSEPGPGPMSDPRRHTHRRRQFCD